MQNDYSLASIIYRVSLETPDKTALIIPEVSKQKIKYFEKISYFEFWNRVSEISYGLKQCFKPGDKVSILIGISVDLYALVIAMLACEIIPVFLDPGMGRKNLKGAINSIELNKFIGTKSLLKYRWFLPRFWKKKFYSIDSSGILVKRLELQPIPLIASKINSQEQTALISFTSGTTGVPKGANRTFYSLFHQHIALRESFPDATNDVDMTCFPIAVLHGLCCGVTNFLPPINFKKIDNFQSNLIIRELESQSITRLTAAPKFLNILTNYMIKNAIVNLNIRALAVGGAIVKESLVKKLQICFPKSNSWIIYGSTEAEPMAKITFKTFIKNNKSSSGHLVGKSVDVADIKIIDTSKLDINLLPKEISSLEVENGHVGELIVSGKHVLNSYINNIEANNEIKIKLNDGTTWHRTMDLAKYDHENNLWLYGRVNDLIKYQDTIIYPFEIEKKLDKYGINSAIVQKKNRIILFIESKKPLANSLNEKVKYILTSFKLNNIQIRNISSLPVDKRHRSKIDRNKLKRKF